MNLTLTNSRRSRPESAGPLKIVQHHHSATSRIAAACITRASNKITHSPTRRHKKAGTSPAFLYLVGRAGLTQNSLSLF